MICGSKIRKALKREIPVIVYEVTDSTSDRARAFVAENACDRMVVVANEQTKGRGRLGRSFYSPADTGIYMTYVFRADTVSRDTLRVTAAAGVAVAKALDCGAQIKWVNDLYLNGKKICGILTETVAARHTYILVGIGINLITADFPEVLRTKAGCVGAGLDREKLIADICDRLSQIADDVSSTEYLNYYRSHMYGIGESIIYTEDGKEHQAVMEGISDFGELIVTENNKRKLLCSGEISVRKKIGGGDAYE